MIGRMGGDRAILEYFESRRTSRAPEGLLQATLAAVDGVGQRPAWRSLDAWLPRTPVSLVIQRARPVMVLVIVALILVVALAIAILTGGPHRLPPPFGVAKPGLIAMDLEDGIYLADANGRNPTRLTLGPDRDSHATFSPDGTKIAFQSVLEDTRERALMVMRADGSDRAILVDRLAEVDDVIAWSPDSRQVAIGARLVAGKEDAFRIFIADVERHTAKQIGGPDMYGRDPRWSPDGKSIAFGRTYLCCGEPPDTLWLMDADGSNARQLSSQLGGSAPAWSQDGQRIVFLAQGFEHANDVFVIRVDGQDERNLTNSPEDELFPVWSPDGTRIAFPRAVNQYGDKAALILIDADGSNPTTMDGAFVTYDPPVWSPDGTRILGYVVRHPEIPGSVESYDAVVIFDVSGRTPPVDIPVARLHGASWQRLAP